MQDEGAGGHCMHTVHESMLLQAPKQHLCHPFICSHITLSDTGASCCTRTSRDKLLACAPDVLPMRCALPG
jgi:hypothetical protein